jgi:hypothetical protein
MCAACLYYYLNFCYDGIDLRYLKGLSLGTLSLTSFVSINISSVDVGVCDRSALTLNSLPSHSEAVSPSHSEAVCAAAHKFREYGVRGKWRGIGLNQPGAWQGRGSREKSDGRELRDSGRDVSLRVAPRLSHTTSPPPTGKHFYTIKKSR